MTQCKPLMIISDLDDFNVTTGRSAATHMFTRKPRPGHTAASAHRHTIVPPPCVGRACYSAPMFLL